MSDIDNDLQERLRRFADDISPEPGRGGEVMRAARRRRRLAAVGAGLMVIVLIGGVAGAVSLLGARDRIDPAPGRGSAGNRTSARYVFEATQGDASATGILDVDVAVPRICLMLAQKKITASHLLLVDADPSGPATMLFTFFERNSGGEGFDLPMSRECFEGEEVAGLRDELQLLVEEPERFRIVFTHGPGNDSRLVAELSPVQPKGCGSGPRINKVTSRAESGQRIAFVGECFFSLTQSEAERIFLTKTMEIAPDDERQGDPRTCRFVAEAVESRHVLEDGKLRGWMTAPTTGECRTASSLRTDVPVQTGRYDVAIGCASCTYASVRITAPVAPPQFESPQQAIQYIADRLTIPVALPRDLPPDTRVDPRLGVTVDSEGRVTTATLKLRFGKNGILGFDFGRAMFDGCGGDGAVEVDIDGVAGLMLAKDELPWTQIIWPAQPGDRQATYGIYGSLPGDELLELGRSMQVGPHREGERAGC